MNIFPMINVKKKGRKSVVVRSTPPQRPKCQKHFMPTYKKTANQWLTDLMVAEAGFEPTTFGL